MLKEEDAKIEISPKELQEKIKEGKSIVKAIEHVLYERGLSLNKSSLAEKIAYIVGEEIKKEDHEKTAPEKEIEKNIRIVESKTYSI